MEGIAGQSWIWLFVMYLETNKEHTGIYASGILIDFFYEESVQCLLKQEVWGLRRPGGVRSQAMGRDYSERIYRSLNPKP